MRTRIFLLAALALTMTICVAGEPASDTLAERFIADLGKTVAAAESADRRVVESDDGWLFFTGELRHLGVGKFWGDEAGEVSRASRKKFADPLPAILEFNAQCKAAGAELILVPVPAKAVIYPEKVSNLKAVAADEEGNVPRLDRHHQAFYALLREKGVNVLDLTDALLAKRLDESGNMYCMHDTHWSSKASRLAAAAISKQVADAEWRKDVPKRDLVSEQRPLEIEGDLWAYLKGREPKREKLPMIYVGTKDPETGELRPVGKDRNSPVVLIGDSHTLVFNAGGDLHTRGAGLADHLALEFGFAVDHVGVRGAGVTVPRIELARRRDNLAGKKLVIWCFSARQFTESTNGWMTGVPVVKPKAEG